MSAPVTTSVADILDRAADLIEPEGAWTQGVSARNKSGARALPQSADAVCWCATGAISRAGGSNWRSAIPAYRALLRVLRRRADYSQIVKWNDAPKRTQAEVVAAIRKAAAKAREALS